MVEKEKIIICDICEKSIAKHKCEVCGKDLCEDCFRSFTLDIENYGFNVIHFCEGCKVKASDLFRGKSLTENYENFDKDNEIKKIILDKIKKNLIIENLKETNGNKTEDN